MTVTTEGSGNWGNVLAVIWHIGELERNFMIMQTSSGTGENIIGERCIAEDRGGCGSISNCSRKNYKHKEHYVLIRY